MNETVDRPDDALLLASMPLPVLVISAQGNILYANDACEGFLSLSKRRMLGYDICDVFAISNDRINQALASGEGDLSAQDMEVCGGSGPVIVDFSITALPNNENSRLVVISPRHVGRPYINEHNQAGNQQSIGAPAILGHEIKNPLAGIKGAAQLLARRVDASSTQLTELIVNEVDRIARLLDQMQCLGYSTPTNLAPANIHILIERAIRSIRAANKTMPEISINYDPSLPDVIIDADAMVQILINLLQNAIDANDNSTNSAIGISTRFVLSGAIRDISQDYGLMKLPVEVIISDNGPGVSSHIVDEVFAPFVTTKRDGQGLGLAIVRKLIGHMNSRIIYDRDHVKGITNFKMFLPVNSHKGI